VSKVGKGKDLFLNIRIKPAANLSRLEEVLVLVEKQERQAVADEKVRMRAADILAQRLPSVPEKPAESASGAKGAGATVPATNAANTNTTLKPKPAAPGGTLTAQPTKNPASAGVVPGAGPAAQTVKPATPLSARPKLQNPPASVEIAKPDTGKPSIVEEKPVTPANPPVIQPAPQSPPDPNNPN
jgi:hypothetical protein